MFKCRNCGGFVYEEEVYWDDHNVKMQQLGCYQCSDKVYVTYEKWTAFKKRLLQSLGK